MLVGSGDNSLQAGWTESWPSSSELPRHCVCSRARASQRRITSTIITTLIITPITARITEASIERERDFAAAPRSRALHRPDGKRLIWRLLFSPGGQGWRIGSGS